MDIPTAKSLIGAIALDIRGDWHDPKWRVQLIESLLGFIINYPNPDENQDIQREKLEAELLYEELQEGMEDIYYDGRWFRDEWSGPYGMGFYTPAMALFEGAFGFDVEDFDIDRE